MASTKKLSMGGVHFFRKKKQTCHTTESDNPQLGGKGHDLGQILYKKSKGENGTGRGGQPLGWGARVFSPRVPTSRQACTSSPEGKGAV